VRPLGAELIDSREILPGQWLQSWHAPWVASGARAGQVVHVRTTEAGGLPLRRVFPVTTSDVASGTITIQAAGVDRPTGGSPPAWARGLRPGDRLDILGPLGRPFEVDSRARHLLLVAEGPSIAAVRLLVDEAIRDGRSVVLLYGAVSSSHVYPSSLIPDEVEYVVATADGSLGHPGSVADLALDYEAWADQSFAAGPPALLAGLARLATGRRGRLGVATLGRKRGGGRQIPPGSPEARRKAFLQVALGHGIGCAAGTCGGCVAQGTGGSVRVCREGPVFAADELDWEHAS
jgi:dihydroorotate dehydrogenase electron transfer subunit